MLLPCGAHPTVLLDAKYSLGSEALASVGPIQGNVLEDFYGLVFSRKILGEDNMLWIEVVP